jgi:hypothetical protein
MTKVHHLARGQWEHRNEVKHSPDNPRYKRMVAKLDFEISRLFSQGCKDLPKPDQRQFRVPLLALRQKTVKHKQAWLANVQAAAQRQERRRLNDDELNTETAVQMTLFKWMKTGRLS